MTDLCVVSSLLESMHIFEYLIHISFAKRCQFIVPQLNYCSFSAFSEDCIRYAVSSSIIRTWSIIYSPYTGAMNHRTVSLSRYNLYLHVYILVGHCLGGFYVI